MQTLEKSIVGQYQVCRYIGAGPLGYVYAVSPEKGAYASHALKILRDDLITNDHDRRVLKLAYDQVREIASDRRVVPALGVWAKQGSVQVLNELDTGQSVESMLWRAQAQGLHLSVRDVLTLLDAGVEAVEALHQFGMPHGDLKPSNMRAVNAYSDERSNLRDIALSDYIYAHLITMRQGMRRQADAAVYAAPEQFDGAVLLASDQYALAAIVFRCLTGKSPFLPKSITSIISQKRDATLLESRSPDLQPAVLSVLQRAMEVTPEARFPSVREFGQALSAAVAMCERELFVSTRRTGGGTRIGRRELLLGAGATVAGFLVTGVLRAPISKAGLFVGASTVTTAQSAPAAPYERAWITKAHSRAASALSWAPSGASLATGGADGAARIWTPTRSQQSPVTISGTGAVNAVAWAPAGDAVALGDDAGFVRLANPLDGRVTMSENLHGGAVYAVDWFHDGKRFVTGSASGAVLVWDVSTRKQTPLAAGPQQAVRAVAVSRNGNLIAAASANSELYVWDVRSGAKVATLPQSSGSLYAVAFSPDSKQVAAAGYDTRIRVWNTDTFDVVTVLPAEDTAPIRSLRWSSDGQALASGSEDGRLVLWKVGSATHEHTSIAIGTPVLALDWQGRTRTLALAGGDGTVSLWNSLG